VGSEVKTNLIADVQAGHTTEVAEAHYGVEERSLYHLDEITLQKSISVRLNIFFLVQSRELTFLWNVYSSAGSGTAYGI